MPADKFDSYWDDITNNRPQSFQKLDVILKNPAPAHIPYSEVLKKMMTFFTGSLNLNVVNPPTNFQNVWNIKAVGEVLFKPPS